MNKSMINNLFANVNNAKIERPFPLETTTPSTLGTLTGRGKLKMPLRRHRYGRHRAARKRPETTKKFPLPGTPAVAEGKHKQNKQIRAIRPEPLPKYLCQGYGRFKSWMQRTKYLYFLLFTLLT